MVIHIFIFMQTCLSCNHYNDNKLKLFPKWEPASQRLCADNLIDLFSLQQKSPSLSLK